MTEYKKIKMKICLLGDPAVGKTSLIQKYIYNFFGDTYMRTLGTKVTRKVVHFLEPTKDIDYEITMMIWDIMGQKFTSVPMDKYLKLSQGALIVCDITRRETFASLEDWKSRLYQEAGTVPVIYLGNKIDLEKNLAFTASEFEKFSAKEKVNHYFTSAKTGENVDKAFLKLGELIITSKFEVPPKPSKMPVVPPPVEPVSVMDGQVGMVDSVVEPDKMPVAANPEVALDSNKTIADTSEVKSPVEETKIEIKPGLSYIIKEERPEQSFKFFKKLLGEDIHGLCITRTHPKRIREEYKLSDIPVYWLSADSPSKKDVVVPTFLPQLNTIIIDFIQKYDNVVILLEGIEYLIDQNDFKAVLSLIHSLNDYIMGSNARLILPIDPLILKERELHMLSRDFKVI